MIVFLCIFPCCCLILCSGRLQSYGENWFGSPLTKTACLDGEILEHLVFLGPEVVLSVAGMNEALLGSCVGGT